MRVLPDVTANLISEKPLVLQWVGMEGIAVPVSINIDDGQRQTVAAKANVYVSLEKPEVKGIHMSRLHLLINQLGERECSKHVIESLLKEMIASQCNIGKEAKIELSFDLLLKKSALLSGENGFQSYPVKVNAEQTTKGVSCEFELTIPYSSTCPCSASLARQLYADAVGSRFEGPIIRKTDLIEWIQSPEGSVATPHSQRSYAYLRLSLKNKDWPTFSSLIVQLEEAIGTAVQTAVKRLDEQEFARLNAINLMFCEDAARRIKYTLEQMSFIEDYWFKVEHQESLHAHNAVVIDRKYCNGG